MGSAPIQEARRKHDDAAQQPEDAVDGDTHDPKRNQKDPDEGVDDQRHQSQRPAEDEQDAPEQELHHTEGYALASNRFIDATR